MLSCLDQNHRLPQIYPSLCIHTLLSRQDLQKTRLHAATQVHCGMKRDTYLMHSRMKLLFFLLKFVILSFFILFNLFFPITSNSSPKGKYFPRYLSQKNGRISPLINHVKVGKKSVSRWGLILLDIVRKNYILRGINTIISWWWTEPVPALCFILFLIADLIFL